MYRGIQITQEILADFCDNTNKELTKLNEEDLELKVLGTGPAIDRINAELQQISNSFTSYKIKKLSVDSIGGV